MILEEAQELVAEEENYFVSMTDLMVGLVFVFIILLMYFALQFQDVTEELTGRTRRAQKSLSNFSASSRNRAYPSSSIAKMVSCVCPT